MSVTAFGSWMRDVSVQVEGTLYDLKSCDIEFEISGGSDGDQNGAEIVLWNLSQAMVSEMVVDSPVRVTAGYAGNTGILFEGYITQVDSERDGADTATKIFCSDASLLLYRSKKFCVEVKEEEALSEVVKRVFSLCNIPVGMVDDTGILFDSPASFYGTGMQILDELLSIVTGRGFKFRCYTESGMGYFVDINTVTTVNVFEISSTTGLLSVERVTDSDENVCGKVVILLNWGIKTDTWLKIDSGILSGYYKAVSYKHTLSGDMYQTEIEVSGV